MAKFFKKLGKGIKKVVTSPVAKVIGAVSGVGLTAVTGGALSPVVAGVTGAISSAKTALGGLEPVKIEGIGGLNTKVEESTTDGGSMSLSGGIPPGGGNSSGNHSDKAAPSLPAPVKVGIGWGLLKLVGII